MRRRWLAVLLFFLPGICFAQGQNFPSSSSGGSGGVTGVTLSSNCPAGSVTAPCINIPSSGGCVQNVSTTTGGLVTYLGSAPSPAPVVGQVAWVPFIHGNTGPCSLEANGTVASDGWAETSACGQVGGSQVTITSVTPGVSVQLSTPNGCTAQSGSNYWLIYGPNIYTQLRAACAAGLGAPLIDAGLYVLDNIANGTHPSCGELTGASGVPGIQGKGRDYVTGSLNPNGTLLVTPPWYNHNGDTGTVIQGPLANLTLAGTWQNLGLAHGTPNYCTNCTGHDYRITGYNFGTSATSEMIYPSIGTIVNAIIHSANRGVTTSGNSPSPQILLNTVIYSQSMAVFAAGNGASNATIRVIGGSISAASASNNGTGVFGVDSGVVPTGDHIYVTNSRICVLNGTASAFNNNENPLEIVLTSTKINDSNCDSYGTNNGSGVTLFSGQTLRASQTSIQANGTGNTLNIPSGATFADNCGNTSSGGAGFSFAGTYVPAGGCAINDAAPTISSGFGTSPSIAAGASVSSFQVNVGTGGAATTGVIGLPTSPKTGWNCQVQDGTTNVATRQTANTASSATFTAAAAWTASDILIISCRPY